MTADNAIAAWNRRTHKVFGDAEVLDAYQKLQEDYNIAKKAMHRIRAALNVDEVNNTVGITARCEKLIVVWARVRAILDAHLGPERKETA